MWANYDNIWSMFSLGTYKAQKNLFLGQHIPTPVYKPKYVFMFSMVQRFTGWLKVLCKCSMQMQ